MIGEGADTWPVEGCLTSFSTSSIMSSLDASVSDSSSLQGFYSWTDTLKGVYYGPGSVVHALPKLLETLGVKKALIVTGRSLYEKVSTNSQ